MARWILALLIAGAVAIPAQEQKKEQEPSSDKQGELKRERTEPRKSDEIAAPPEEDDSMGVREYAFNPLQSEKEMKVGNYYFKQRNYRAAAMRYREAVKWNEKNSDAWLRLAEAAEKSMDSSAAREAYQKYLALEPDAKNVRDIRKKIEKLK